MLSYMSLVNGMAPILAPVIGSQLLGIMDWPGIFWFLAGYGALVVIAAFVFIIETLPPEKRHSDGVSVASRYKAVFSDRIFVGTLFVGGLNFAALFTYLSASTFLFQNTYGFTPQQYGYLFAVNSLGVVAGVQIAARIMRHTGPQWVIAVGNRGPGGRRGRHGHLRPAWPGPVGHHDPALVLHLRHGLHVPLRPGHGPGPQRQAGRHGGIPAGRCNLWLRRADHPRGGLGGRRRPRSMATDHGRLHLLAMAALWLIVRPRTVPKI